MLYFLIIDGRQKGYSEGATTGELGLWLKALGAWDGINLDGGGTSTLVIQHGDSARVVNRPIHGGIPGQERVSASHLGVFAPPVKPGE
jgi:exopolysaccharide biosynthesis protein